MAMQARTTSLGSSTTHAPRAGTAERLLRTSLRTLARLSPSLAARALDRLWFRAPRTRPEGEALSCLAQARRVTMQVHGRPVAVWQWGEAGPWVLLMHGWGGHAGQLHAFVAPLLAAGLRVVAFDAPAHGLSGASRHGGRRVTFFEFVAALQALTARLGAMRGAIAHSGGCTALALAMRQGWQAPPRLAFIAPFSEPDTAIGGFAGRLGLDGEPESRFRARAAGWLGIDWRELDIAGLPPARRQAALFIAHDRGDREVPLRQSQRLAEAWPGARLLVTEGAGHRRILTAPPVVQAAVAFVAEVEPPAAAASEAIGQPPALARDELDLAYEATGRFWRPA